MPKPRLHWISPLPPARTDIAHYTRRILPDLCREADVTLWTDATSWDPELESFCSVRQYNPETLVPRLMCIQEADAPATVFAHIGNSWVFHSLILQLALRMPTVVVLHDLALQEMYLDTISAKRLLPEIYRQGMQRAYGDAGLAMADRALSHSVDRGALSQDMPFFQLCLQQAHAVVTHTQTARDAVRNALDVPVYNLHLPFTNSSHATADRPSKGPLRFVQFGHTGPNRRLELVLEALADIKDTADFTFDIIGHVWDPDRIQRKRNELGLKDQVFLHGFLPEPVLDFALSRAHLAFNLRNPTMGEASGSQLRIWRAAGASVVTDHGWYAELPDETVFKVPLEREKEALVALLKQISMDRHIGHEKGQSGFKRLSQLHAPDQYAREITNIARSNEADAHNHALRKSFNRLKMDMAPETRAVASNRFAALFQ